MTDHNDAIEAAARLCETWPKPPLCGMAREIRALKREPSPPSADVAGVLERLENDGSSWAQSLFNEAAALIRTLAAERDAIKDDYLRRHKDACDRYLEIVALKSNIHHLIADPDAELGCQADNETVLQAIVDLKRERDAAVSFIRVIGEELVLSGMPAGDRDAILANVRRMRAERDAAREAVAALLNATSDELNDGASDVWDQATRVVAGLDARPAPLLPAPPSQEGRDR